MAGLEANGRSIGMYSVPRSRLRRGCEMAKRKEQKKYTADELRALKAKLITHRTYLIDAIQSKIEQAPNDLDAIGIRDLSDQLVRTCCNLSEKHGQSKIDICIALAEHRGSTDIGALVLDECGLSE